MTYLLLARIIECMYPHHLDPCSNPCSQSLDPCSITSEGVDEDFREGLLQGSRDYCRDSGSTEGLGFRSSCKDIF